MVSLFAVLTWCGSILVLLPTAFIVVFVFRKESWLFDGSILLGGVGGASILANVFKQLFARPRPEVQEMLIAAPSGFSFPSAHATQAFAFATACIVVFGRNMTFIGKLILYGLLGGGAAIVAYSRVYLRVHYLSDIVFGAILGVAWVLLLFALLRFSKKR